MKKRIFAILIDYVIIFIICQVILFVYTIAINSTPFQWLGLYTKFAIFLVILKDLVFKNASIGKKILKIEIRTENNEVPSIAVIILRNITVIIWPIEFLLIIIGKRKVGDMIFKTKVVETNTNIK